MKLIGAVGALFAFPVLAGAAFLRQASKAIADSVEDGSITMSLKRRNRAGAVGFVQEQSRLRRKSSTKALARSHARLKKKRKASSTEAHASEYYGHITLGTPPQEF